MAVFDFQFEQGAVHFPALGLWLDAHRPIGPEETVFVSHAHSDHTAAHARVILSVPTRRLMRARVGGKRDERELEFGHRIDAANLGLGLPGGFITLLPAGHILGSAMILLEGGGTSLLYTGDFKLRRSLSAEACEPRPADVLVMETTFGRPQYTFPPTDAIVAGVVRFCHEALDNGETPVLLGYSLGKSQEILAGLEGAGLPIVLSEPVAKLTAVYESLGCRFPAYEVLDFKTAAGKVVLAPPGMAVSSLKKQLGPCRTAVLTGWAVDPGSRYRYQADAAFPLSDHADFPDLVEFVKRVAPRQVYTLHGFAADFAAHLRQLGFQAQALSETEQLDLTLGAATVQSAPELGQPSVSEPMVASGTQPARAGSFLAFASAGASIGSERGKPEKVRRLAQFLASVDPAVLASVTSWLTHAGPASTTGRSLSVGGSVLRQALCVVSGVSEAAFRNCYLKHNDTGETAAELLSDRMVRDVAPLELSDVAALLDALASARGPAEKLPLLARMLDRCGPLEAKFLIRILTGNLRIGLKDDLVEDAVTLAFSVEPEAVRTAHQWVGHLGEVALLARAGRLGEAELVPLRPVKGMLASPEPTAAAVWERVTEWNSANGSNAGAWVEDTYDGIRCQLHKVGSRVALFSRDLQDVTDAFPEVVAAAASWRGDVVLDGAVVAVGDGRALRPEELQRRLGCRQRDLFLESDIPVCFVAFDLLWRDGRSRVRETLGRRRAELAGVEFPSGMRLASGRLVTNAADIDAEFEAALARGNEGLMIKNPASLYLPGRHGIAWLTCASATTRPSRTSTPG